MSGLELKPCPFCGGEAQLFGQIPAYCGAKVSCTDCEAESSSFRALNNCDDANKSAIAAWNCRTPDPAQIRADAIRDAVWAAFIAGVGQGSDEATAYEWGTAPQQSRQHAFDDFMADWNEDSAYLRALIDTPLSPPAVDGSIAPDAGGKEDV